MAVSPTSAVEVFYSYAHADETLRDALEKHLKTLQRQGLITQWHDRRIDAGTEWAHVIDTHLNTASLILLLVSSDFIASDYCYDLEMQRALERHHVGAACVIPIILRPCDWQATPFAALQAFPTNGKPITTWINQDEALLDVVRGIRTVLEAQIASNAQKPAHHNTPSQLVPVCNIPYARNPFFTNREQTLKQLHSTLQINKSPTMARALSGMSGVGKTQTAVEYAYRHREDYQHVLWVSSDTYETLLTDVASLTELLNLPGQKAQDQHTAVNALKNWLQHHNRWLLIFDNADNLAVIRHVLPSEFKGHVLLTTKAQALGGLARRVDIEEMGREEGALFLLRRAHLLAPDEPLAHATQQEVALAQTIADVMGGLPLALDQAGAYIEEVACSLLDYLELYRTQQARLLKWRGGIMNDHPEPIAHTLALSFNKVAQAQPVAADLLRFLAFLHPDAIPEELITQGAPELGPLLQSLATDPFLVNTALAELLKFSLIHRDAAMKTLSLHRLTQIVLKDAMDEGMQRLWAERTVRALNRVFPNPRFYEHWELCKRCLAHCQTCLGHIQRWQLSSSPALQLLTRTGYYLMRRGLHAEAAIFYQQARAISQSFIDTNQREVADILYRQGELDYIQGKYAQAEQLYQQALALREHVLGPEHPDVALSLHNLALLYDDWGKHEGIEQLYQQALAIWEHTLGSEHPDVAEGLNNLASHYISQGRYTEAEPLLYRSLAIREKAFGDENPDTVLSVYFLAKLYLDQNQHDKAEPLLRQGLAMCERVLGSEHPYMATYQRSLGLIARRAGKYQEAEEYYQKARATAEQALGTEHPDVVQLGNDLAEVYRAEQKYSEAEQLYQQALMTQERVLGPEHPHVATVLTNLAELYSDTGQYAQAEPLYLRALAIREKVLGTEHPAIATLLANYATLLQAMGRQEEAASLEARIVSIRGSGHQ